MQFPEGKLHALEFGGTQPRKKVLCLMGLKPGRPKVALVSNRILPAHSAECANKAV